MKTKIKKTNLTLKKSKNKPKYNTNRKWSKC